MSDFFFTKDPSFFFTINFIFLSIRENVLFANNNPPIIASSLAINFALIILLFFTRLEVISPEGYKSSFSASLTVFLIKFSLSFI